MRMTKRERERERERQTERESARERERERGVLMQRVFPLMHLRGLRYLN